MEAFQPGGRAYGMKAREIVGDCYEELRGVLEHVNDYALFFLDRNGQIASWNEGAARETGYAEAEVLGRYFGLVFTAEDRTAGVPEKELAEARRTGRADDTRWLVCKDGSRFWAEGALTAIRAQDGHLKGFLKVSRNATERKQFEQALKEKDNWLKLALAAGQMGTWRWDIEADADVLDESMAALCGLQREPTTLAIGDFYALVHQSDRAAVKDAFEESMRVNSDFRLDFRVIWPDGTAHWLTDHWRHCDGLDGQARCLTGACMDISDRKIQESKLDASIKDKELLLKEIHHRVKNSLGVVASLLSMQGKYNSDPAIQRSLAEVQDRVRAIAGLHEQLYDSRDLANVDFGEYMGHLVRELDAVYNVKRDDVLVRIAADQVVLGLEEALPLGLILNELICNAFKHAFPGERPGNIDVSLRYVSHESASVACELSVKDDGVGTASDPKPAPSMGTQLVTLLVRQLHGTVSVNHDNGTKTTVRFPIDATQRAVARAGESTN